jgi:cytochrome c553
MTRMQRVLSVACVAVAASLPLAAAEFPAWAYADPAPNYAGKPDDGVMHHVPGSLVAFSYAEINASLNHVPDWFPSGHPPMPSIVKEGRGKVLPACAYCHLPTGAGRPENAGLAGLTAAYITQQIGNFRNDARTGSDPRRGPQKRMIAIAKALTDAEVAEAAAYFASLKPASFVTVVESATAPQSYVAGAMLAKVAGGGTEPLAGRIIEVPDDLARAEDRDPNTTYTAYVPVGSLRRGAGLVDTGGGGKTLQCMTCHGAGLRGLGDMPRIAGRSPSYLMRQLFDIRAGKRAGTAVLMPVVVAHLSDADLVDIVAYVSSLPP